MARDSFDHLGDFQVAFVVDGVNLDAGALLALLVGDLANVGVNLVNRQARARFQVAAVLNLDGPLIATGKLQVAQGFSAVLGIGFRNQAQKFNRIPDAAIHVCVLPCHKLSPLYRIIPSSHRP